MVGMLVCIGTEENPAPVIIGFSATKASADWNDDNKRGYQKKDKTPHQIKGTGWETGTHQISSSTGWSDQPS